ncbi:Potassium channel [Orbilia ellipsospora]|uniref:Potassium channel n=1 Tax=Orbilia ellipsospora TaxID=2528407 RepID=A0AAV9X9Q5_9PEZI
MHHIRTRLLGEALNRHSRKSSRGRSASNLESSSQFARPTVEVFEGKDTGSDAMAEKSSQPSSSKSRRTDNDNSSGNDNDLDIERANDDADDNEDGIDRMGQYEKEFEIQTEPPIKWWFAAKGIPLVAATVGPLANLTSVAALVSPWRANLSTDGPNAFDQRYDMPFTDPKWVTYINAASLIFGFIGNFFLMCNYSRRIKYKIAMPVTILCWYIAFGLLSGILLALVTHAPTIGSAQVYTQAFWYGVISAGLYLFSATILFVNIAGYLKGHYPSHIESSVAEKNLMLQTIFFFAWMAIGALVFAKLEAWTYSDALYFCNVTLLTVGFGDIYATTDSARGFVFPFSVIGIIMLGLVVNSIHGFVVEIGEKQVVEQHINHRRQDVANRAVATSSELRRDDPELAEFATLPMASEPTQPDDFPLSPTTIRFCDNSSNPATLRSPRDLRSPSLSPFGPLRRATSLSRSASIRSIPRQIILAVRGRRRTRPILLRASRDRFEAMRRIQHHTLKFKQWTALVSSSVAFLTLWLLGAVIFMFAEKDTQHLTYFQSLYFCYVSLLTIGYGDLSPRSNAGKAFFLLWSIWSVPTITILISSMGSTVIQNFQNATLRLAEFTILPKKGIRESLWDIWADWRHERAHRRAAAKKGLDPRLSVGVRRRSTSGTRPRSALSGISEGSERSRPGTRPGQTFQMADNSEQQVNQDDQQQDNETSKPLPEDYTFQELLVALTEAIREVGKQVALDPKHSYEYEEWVEFTRLIRACELVKPDRLKGVKPGEEIARENIDSDEGFVLWDWIGEDSPLLHEGQEPAWVQDRLTKGLEQLVHDHLQSISLSSPTF